MFLEFNYLPRAKKERGRWRKQDVKAHAKATLGYNAHRVGKDKEKMDRVLFGNHGTLTEEQAAQMIEAITYNTYVFRMKLSPDPKT